MALAQCPECGEDERLSGQQVGETITLSCDTCGASWERDSGRRCRSCGSDDLRYTPKPLWENGRGEQRTPAGTIDAYACGEADVVASIGELL